MLGLGEEVEGALGSMGYCLMVSLKRVAAVEGNLSVSGLYRPDYPHADGFLRGAPAMIQEWFKPLSLVGSIRCWPGSDGFYGVRQRSGCSAGLESRREPS
jgi:hypothetical protein